MIVIGDHWSVLLIRECFYGIRRFGGFQRRLGIATNILTERLNRLVAGEVLFRRALDAGRNEYPRRRVPPKRSLVGPRSLSDRHGTCGGGGTRPRGVIWGPIWGLPERPDASAYQKEPA